MINRINIVILLTLEMSISFLGVFGISQALATSPIAITSQYTTYPSGTTSITFTATTVSGVSEVSFYYGTTSQATYIGTDTDGTCTGGSAGTCTFTYTWNSPPSGTFNVFAVVGGGSSAGTGTNNGVIDMVGDPHFTFTYLINGTTMSTPEVNPALDPIFGLTSSFSGCANAINPNTWQGGDNQMCQSTWPYNGATGMLPYGTCEWTGSSLVPIQCSSLAYTPEQTPVSTVDSLDETMHILSGFSLFSQNILNNSVGSLNSTFDTWYPQAASWIAPECANSNSASACTCSSETDCAFDTQTCVPGESNPCNPFCQSATSSDTTCNQTSPGRMLSIYDPTGYPGVTGVSSNTAGTVDELQTWNAVISSWLNTSFTPAVTGGATSSDLWCVPSETALLGTNSITGGPNSVTAEDNYIKSNAPTPTWGDLSHVIACLNYNAGSTPSGNIPNASNLQACLAALTSYAPGACPSSPPYQCAAVAPPNTLLPTDCDPYYISTENVPSYANEVNSQINFGARNNYKACLNALTSGIACTSQGDTLPEACAPWLLGRDLLNPNSETVLPFTTIHTVQSKDINCDPAYTTTDTPPTVSYAKWVNDSLTLFTDEQPKFALRSAFLTDIYNRAQTMQNIFAQGDQALHNFFKPCGTPTCTDGGPAAQLIYARSLSNPVRNLPNSVIYGWVDPTLPNGQSLPGTPAGQPGGTPILSKSRPMTMWRCFWCTSFVAADLGSVGVARREDGLFRTARHGTARRRPHGVPVAGGLVPQAGQGRSERLRAASASRATT